VKKGANDSIDRVSAAQRRKAMLRLAFSNLPPITNGFTKSCRPGRTDPSA